MTNSQTNGALQANIALLDEIVLRIMDYTTQAKEASTDGKMLEAIGTLCYVQQDMQDADSLLKAIFAINRQIKP